MSHDTRRLADDGPVSWAAMSDDGYCPKCEGDGSYSELAPCTTFDSDCACNGPLVLIDPCEVCGGSGDRPVSEQPTFDPALERATVERGEPE